MNHMKKAPKNDKDSSTKKDKYPLPVYSPDEDIYNKEKEVRFNEDEEVTREKLHNKMTKSGDDLDIPGSELDDADEVVGEEDEENNYYSLGGDNHEDLEEDK